MGKFIITKRANGEFQFNLKANNGMIILTSEGYTTKANCENSIESVKRFSQENNLFRKYKSVNGKHYFTLVASNGQIIGTSQMYSSDFASDKGINSVKSNAPDSDIEDKTNKRFFLNTATNNYVIKESSL